MYIRDYNFSLWADFIERDFIQNGLKDLIERGIVNGATSNPAIFKSAILSSKAYKKQLKTLEGHSAKEKYEALAIADIQAAADVMRPLYDAGDDGFVSIEVDPYLCDDAEGTIEEGTRLFKTIDRPNVMIKVPATKEGYIAMEALVAQGIPVNATLVFSQIQALSCASAFKRALSQCDFKVKTVISVFVSRLDRAMDARLKAHDVPTALSGIYNASMIYEDIESLRIEGCRTLFASTGVKGDDLEPSYYVDQLLAANSVNTAPIATIDAFVKEGDTEKKLPIDRMLIEKHFRMVADCGINFQEEIEIQIKEGLDAFKQAFQEILDTLEK